MEINKNFKKFILIKEKDFEVGELADREGIEDWRIKGKILTEIVK